MKKLTLKKVQKLSFCILLNLAKLMRRLTFCPPPCETFWGSSLSSGHIRGMYIISRKSTEVIQKAINNEYIKF